LTHPTDPTAGPGSPPPAPHPGTRPLWKGRIAGEMAPAMVLLNRSLDVDRRLWSQDVRGSQAWARALVGAGVLEPEEGDALIRGLEAVGRRLGGGEEAEAPDEDIHSLVERLLFQEVGALAGKLHTGRSRNDQVATDLRLWSMEATVELEDALLALATALHQLAGRSLHLLMPGYTHLQQGQPVRAAHWVLSHFWPLMRDVERIRRAKEGASVLPLGSGAIAGCPFPVDREALRDWLGFRRISRNSMDAVSDRDWAAELVFACALAGIHISRLCEDLVLFSSFEFGFLRLSDGYSTGSSLMPQKRNPDVAELARGKSGRLVGALAGFLTLLKGLPTGYNRDLQEDKSILFDAVDTLLLVAPAVAGAVEEATWQEERVKAALDTRLLATDLADHLVRQGVPFRTTHEVVGALVQEAESRGCRLHELPAGSFGTAHVAFGDDPHALFDWNRSVESRGVPGGTAEGPVRAQLEEAGRLLQGS